MKLFVTGATGYIGGSVAARLAADGYEVLGLARSEGGAAALEALGVEPHRGDLGDSGSLRAGAGAADAVINAADADDAEAADTLIATLEGTGKRLIHTSGSSIVGDRAEGEPTDRIYDDETDFEPLPEKLDRVAIDRRVRAAADGGVHTIVICPTMIYGPGRGPKADSIQVPMMIEQARAVGVSRHIGAGKNIWSNVHIDDLVDLYVAALEQAPPGSFFFAENGERELREIAAAIGRMLGMPVGSWSVQEAEDVWGFEAAHYALGSNSRVRGIGARRLLGWQPATNSIIEDIDRSAERRAR